MNPRHRHEYVFRIRQARHDLNLAYTKLDQAMQYGIDHNAEAEDTEIMKQLVTDIDGATLAIDHYFPAESIWGV